MSTADPKEARDRIARWFEESQRIASVLLGFLYEYERTRDRADSAERECQRLRAEASRLRTETERYRSEQDQIADSLSKVMGDLHVRLKAERPAPSALKILLIEDEAEVREVLALMLTSEGHSVLQAAGGREGLGRLEAGERVDLVLTDLRMPGMTGWEVARAVKARWPHVPVGLVTGTPEALTEARDPVDLVIPKPVTVDALREAIIRVRP